MNIADAFKAKAKKYNNYQEGPVIKDRKCRECVRWQMSFPYTCNDWDIYSTKAETCINWSNNPRCKVD